MEERKQVLWLTSNFVCTQAMELARGRPAGHERIVPHLMSRDQIEDECISLFDLGQQIGGHDSIKVLEWMATRKLIRNESQCTNCSVAMSLIRRNSAKVEEYMWRCKICKSSKSVRDGSFFTRSKLPLVTIIRFLYCWARDMPQKHCAFESGLGTRCTRTTVDWANFCRDVCEHWLEENPSIVGGLDDNGQPKVVEIDQSKFFYRKYHRGLWKEGHWVFGGIERGTGKCFLVEVPDRNTATLTDLIRKFILPGTVIVSNGWVTHANISAIDGGIYEHSVNVENMWKRAKHNIRKQLGISSALFTSYLHEFLWRNAFKDADLFVSFMICIWSIYDFN